MADELVLSHAELESRDFVRRVYNWMTTGLAATGLVAWYMAANPQMIVNLVHNGLLFIGLLIVEFGLVFVLAGAVSKMSAATASAVFLFYAALNGVTLSVVFLRYTHESIGSTFFVTAGTFALMALYGHTTKADLTSWGNLLFMALLGSILGSVVNFWLRNPMVYWGLTYANIAIFTGLTAYDAQRIKQMFRLADEETEAETVEAISGALALYLDFVNLFLQLLRVLGKRDD